MSNKIFLINENNQLRPLVEQPYANEDLLQSLLERYPDLLAGDQVDPENPRRWLLVKREMEVPDDEDAGGRWSLDHLFLDQDGILTLVEVKRASDTRARREVVAQMLDYAANAVLYWPVETIKGAYEETARAAAVDPIAALEKFLAGASPDDFWAKVKVNLEAEKIRMVFVADAIPRSLQRIVEFLNEQMDPAEVLAIELKQFVGQDVRTLVPRLLGQTAKTATKAGVHGVERPGARWDAETFATQARASGHEDVIPVASRLREWFEKEGLGIRWGNGKEATFTGRFLIGGEDKEIFRVFSSGMLGVNLDSIPSSGFSDHMRIMLRAVPGARTTDSRNPTLRSITHPEACEKLLEVLEFARQHFAKTSSTKPGNPDRMEGLDDTR